MNKIIKDQINQLKPSATLAINEESNRLKKKWKKNLQVWLWSISFSSSRVSGIGVKKKCK